jgi:hypothetical protein
LLKRLGGPLAGVLGWLRAQWQRHPGTHDAGGF